VSRIPSSLAALFPRTDFAKSVALLSSATAAGQAIVLLAAPVLTRLYGPDDFGVLGVYASILGIVSVIASLRYEQAIPLPGEDRVASNVLGVALIIVGITSLAIGVAVYLAGGRIVELANIEELAPYLYLIPIGVFLVGTYQVLNYWAVRQKAFPMIARTTLAQGGGSVVTQLTLGAFGTGALGLIIGQIVGQAAGITTLLKVARDHPARPLEAISPEGLKSVARRYRRFPQLFTWSALLNSLGLLGPTILIAGFYGAMVAGWFALVQRILGVPTSLLGRSVTDVYFSESARLAREAPAELQTLFLNVLKKLMLLGCVTIVPLGLVSPWLFPLVFGDEWVTSGRYALILCPMILLQFMSSPFGVTLAVLERQDLAMLREIVRLVLVGFALVYAQLGGYSAEVAVIFLSIAGAISYLSHLFISWLAIRQHKFVESSS
jgi:O-antigen/teichoic acid export membrane protein